MALETKGRNSTTDLRVQKTYKALTDSFTALMEEMRFEEITIGLLCDRAMIRRTTFYKHFDDKNEFFQFYMERIRDDFRAVMADRNARLGSYECETMMADELMTFLSRHSNLMDNVLKSNALDNLLWSLSDFIADSILEAIDAANANEAFGDIDEEMFAAFVAGGLVKMILQWWIEGHTDEGRDKIFNALGKLHSRLVGESA